MFETVGILFFISKCWPFIVTKKEIKNWNYSCLKMAAAWRWQPRLITELNQRFLISEIRKVRRVEISNLDVMSNAFSTYTNPKVF